MQYDGDEFYRRCACRKSRWSKVGNSAPKTAKTRRWTKAEEAKRELEHQFEGRQPESAPSKTISAAVDLFIMDKATVCWSADTVNKYKRLLKKEQAFCEEQGVYTMQGITRDLIPEFCAKWPEWYPSSVTRSKLCEKLRSFLRYCYEAQWLPR